MADGAKLTYGMEVDGSRLVLTRVSSHGVPQVVHTGPRDAEESRRWLETIGGEVENGAAALAVCAPAAQTVVRRLQAPFASAKKAARVWPSLLDVELPFPVEGAVCDFGRARAGNGVTVTFAAAFRAADLAEFDATCQSAGFNPTHVDAEALALWDQLGSETPAARTEQPRALAWVGMDHVTVVRGRGADFMAAHVLRLSPLGGEEAQKAFAVLWASRMGPVLSAHLAETESPEMDLWWAGPGAEDESLMPPLRRQLPSALAIRHERVRQPGSFLARALARRAASGSGVNFKVGEFAHPARLRREARQRRKAYLGVVAAAVLVLAVNAGEAWKGARADCRVQQQLTTTAEAIAGMPVPSGQEALMVERAVVRRDEETQPFRIAMDPSGLEGRFVQVMDALAALDVEVAQFSMSPAALSIQGSSASIQAVEALAEALRGQGWTVQSDTPGQMPDGRPRFVLKGTVAP